MRSTAIRPLAVGIGLTAALSLVPAAAASAATTHHHHHYAPTKLTLSVKSAHTKKHTVTLKCDPARGSHPHAQDACTALAMAHGTISKLPPREQFAACPMIYMPVTAKATGEYRGRHVSFKKTYANECTMMQATGSVFDLSR
ncbi:MAG TPA: SSI family serine proteinase inhibitor [Sporichthyaceae bacterium]|jgi:hypothetical protein